jgi:hypothetical protein
MCVIYKHAVHYLDQQPCLPKKDKRLVTGGVTLATEFHNIDLGSRSGTLSMSLLVVFRSVRTGPKQPVEGCFGPVLIEFSSGPKAM